jgi:hypothetical protein
MRPIGTLPLLATALGLLALALPASAGAASRHVRYAGLEEQNQPVTLTFDRRLRRLQFRIGYIPYCVGTGGESEGDRGFDVPRVAGPLKRAVLPVDRRGRFERTFRFSRDMSSRNGKRRSELHRRGRIAIAGRLRSRGRASGTIRVRYRERSVQASPEETLEFAKRCDSFARDWRTPTFTFDGPWRPTGPAPRSHAPDVLLSLADGRVLSAGGADNGSATPGAALYSPSSNGWSRTEPLATPRDNAAAVRLANGRVLVAGGYRDYRRPNALRSAESFNPQTRRWSATGSMATPRQGAAVALLPDGRALVAGGARDGDPSGLDGFRPTASVETFDPRTGAWAAAAAMPFALPFLDAAVLPSGRVLVVGGESPNGGAANSARSTVYDPVTGTWSAPETVDRLGRIGGLVTLAGGRVLAVGGYLPTPGAAIYTDGVGWTQAATPPAFVQSGTARLPSGRALVMLSSVGGDVGAQRAAVYDPGANSWALAPPYFLPQEYRTAAARLVGVGGGALLVDDGPTRYTRAERFFE